MRLYNTDKLLFIHQINDLKYINDTSFKILYYFEINFIFLLLYFNYI